ncbi:MAG: hypothetical protein J7501_00245 [Bdellovibrio sp.]|nr:hypothetical protein [Bdellovibrio sp.]
MIWNRLHYEILNLKNPEEIPSDKWNAAYSFWKAQWNQFIQEHQLEETLFSDDFTRSDSAGVLYLDNKIASIILYKERDLTRESSKDDSYFKVWPKELIEQLTRDRVTKVMSAGYLTVHPLLRGEKFQPSLKNIMVELVGRHLGETSAHAMICVTNNLKGVNGSTERCGWTLAASGLQHFNHPVNLYVLTRENAKVSPEIENLYPSSKQKRNLKTA